MKKWLKEQGIRLLMTVSVLTGLIAGGIPAYAASGPNSYNYTYWGETAAAPAAYQPKKLITGASLGIGELKEPSDIHVTSQNRVYVLDSGNNRIVVLEGGYKKAEIIDSFDNKGKKETFQNPQGIYVTDDGQVIVADTGNNRVVHLDSNHKLVKIIGAPQSDLLQANFTFQPARVIMDKAQRIYVMATGVFDGLMEFSANGDFTSFIGANKVQVDPVEYFWKMLSTKEQRSQMVMFTPTEFTNVDINDEGFIYATNADTSGNNIKMLNAQGTDILRREGKYPPQGDIRYTSNEERSRLIDIDVADSEIYSVLDSKKGRIFTYNGDGHLMYIFGGLGNQLGQFHTPIAMERAGDDFLVLDKALGEVTVYEMTEYGRTLTEAVRSYYRGDEEKAFEAYNETINLNANLEFAYSGIGKALNRKGAYYDAMEHFKLSLDQENYSKSFLLYRKEELREHLSLIMTIGIILAAGALVAGRLGKLRARKKVVSIDD